MGTHNQEEFLLQFAELDDNDVISAAKLWSHHEDQFLSIVCKSFVSRKLPRIEIQEEPFDKDKIKNIRLQVADQFNLPATEAELMVVSDSVSNHAYSALDDNIKILDKHGKTRDITEASDILNVSVLSKTVRKFFLCYPKNLKELF